MVFKKLKIEDFKKIGEIISEGENSKVSFRNTNVGNLFIYGDEETELYLKSFPLDGITISRVYFYNQRKGTMSKILDELKIYCNKNNLNKIIIESAMTNEMISFANKHNFKPVENCTFNSNGVIVGNYELKLG